ncbi:MAG: sigma 54-interacting transcriptional regulator [Vicinamibacteria bacterium]
MGDVPVSVQTSLLRVLQEREIIRVGESKPRKIDVRILAATQHDLAEAVARGQFRADLLYRIRVARVALPPLRERREDIPLLVAWFLGECRATIGKAVDDVSDEAMRRLLEHGWPGNVRELRSALEFAILHARGSVVRLEDLPPEVRSSGGGDPGYSWAEVGNERMRILAALDRAGGNRTFAAALLGISRATLYRRLASLDIPPS